MKKVLKGILIVMIAIILIIALFLTWLFTRPSVPTNYTKTVATGGNIEAKYLAMGEHKVKYLEQAADDPIKKYEIYYPQDLESDNGQYPVVIFVNGTGVPGSKYKALFKHLASWGFIVVGNEDPSTGWGTSADQTLIHMIELNEDSTSIFFGKIDTENIGLSGHSQGGAGVLCAASVQDHADLYKTVVALSPTHEEMAHAFTWMYDMEKITCPLLMLSGTEGEFETQSVIPIEAMNAMYEKVSGSKVMLRRIGTDHGGMLYSADGYVTAWFMWQLQDDQEAAEAFIGSNPEIMNNSLYQDQRIDLGE